MITTDGRLHIKKFLMGAEPTIAESLAFGVGTTIESLTDTVLNYETGRAPISLVTYDFVNNKLIFKGTVPSEFSGSVYEVALFSQSINSLAGIYGSNTLTSFDMDTEAWTNAAWATSNVRIGVNGIVHTPAASGTTTSALTALMLDLSGNSGADLFKFAYNVGNAFTSQITFRFMVDASNYYSISLGAQTAGYKTVAVAKSSAVATGTPSWNAINEIDVITTSTAGGASSVTYDGIRIEDIDTVNPDYVCVAREVVSVPFVKEPGKNLDVEFSLTVSIV